jgi:hypothetical protein
MFRARIIVLVSALLTVGVTVAAPPAHAADAPPTADQQLVRRLADLDPRWEVQTAAWTALLDPDPRAATDFLAVGGGYDQARAQAANDAAINDAIIAQTVATSTPDTSPSVYATAVRASHGTLAEKDRYVRVGLAAARKLDAAGGPVQQAAQQARADRDYVADLAQHASGAWVRAAAARAVQNGTDNDIANFFKYDWASASGCDTEAFRIAVTDEDTRFRHQLAQLVTAAQQAQQAYEQASDAAKAKAADEARASWNTAADVAEATQAKWLSEAALATAQAQSWSDVRDFALAATTQQDWPAIATRADGTVHDWSGEVTWAQQQADTWSALAASTRASAEAIPPTTTTSGR